MLRIWPAAVQRDAAFASAHLAVLDEAQVMYERLAAAVVVARQDEACGQLTADPLVGGGTGGVVGGWMAVRVGDSRPVADSALSILLAAATAP